jgi:hypothetical protein
MSWIIFAAGVLVGMPIGAILWDGWLEDRYEPMIDPTLRSWRAKLVGWLRRL